MQTETLYRDILKKAFYATLKNKKLWFLGFFIAPLMGGGLRIMMQGFQAFSPESSFGGLFSIASTGLLKAKNLKLLTMGLIQNPLSLLIFILIILVMLFFCFFIIWIITVSEGAIIDGAEQADGKKLSTSKFNNFIGTGIKNFWPVFGVNFFVKIISYLAVFLVSIPFVIFNFSNNQQQLKNSVLLYIFFAIIFLPIAIALMFTGRYAINYIVIQKINFWKALKKGYNLFLNNWVISIEMGVILFFISLCVMVLMPIIAFFIIIPTQILIYLSASLGSIFLVITLLVIALLTLIVISVLLVSVLATFQACCWVYLFKEIDSSKPTVSKIIRMFGK